jgi:hypothetical protein
MDGLIFLSGGEPHRTLKTKENTVQATETNPAMEKRVNIVRKLLTQASHPGTGCAEAEAFMGKAQEMIERFNINQAMLAEDDPDDTPAEIERRVIYDRKKGKMPTWILTLARGVSQANRVKHWYSSSRSHGTITAAGTADNLTTAEMLMPFLVGQVDRLYKEEKPCWLDRSQGKRWGTSFRNGCSSRVTQRLIEALQAAEKAMRAEASQTPEDLYRLAMEAGDTDAILKMDREGLKPNQFPLAKVETALARLEEDGNRAHEWVEENMKLRSGSRRNHYGTSSSGFKAGHKAGNRVTLSAPKGRIG